MIKAFLVPIKSFDGIDTFTNTPDEVIIKMATEQNADYTIGELESEVNYSTCDTFPNKYYVRFICIGD